MLKSKVFETHYDLADFVNKNIKREDIQQIVFSHDVPGDYLVIQESYWILFYWEED